METPFFRLHRGGFEESMETAATVKDMEELKQFLSNHIPMTEDNTNIFVNYYTYDERLSLHTYYVLANGYVVGFICDDSLERW